MRNLPILAVATAALLLGACGSVDYRDTNADVDQRPECDKSSQHPGDVAAPWCTREQSATWSSDDKGEPVDFKKKPR
jgi:hypothetical protein